MFKSEHTAAEISFLTEMDDLALWDSKPWALYTGNFVEKSLISLLRLGRGRGAQVCGGDPRHVQRRDLLDYNVVELYSCGRDGIAPGDPGGRALLQELCDTQKKRQIRSLGLRNWPCGLRAWTAQTTCEDPFLNVTNIMGSIQVVLKIVAELWTEWWHLLPRVYLVGPHEGDEEHCFTLDVIVEFVGERTSMSNVPVLISNWRTAGCQSFAAYVDPFATWVSVATVCGYDSCCVKRKGNRDGIWFGNRLVLHDLPMPTWPGLRIIFEAPMDMNRNDDEGPQNAKRPKFDEQQPASSSRSTPDERSGQQRADEDEVQLDSTQEEVNKEDDDPFAHLFHLFTDYSRSRLRPAKGAHLGRLAFLRREQVAEIWEVPTEEIVGLHPLRARPFDLPAHEEALITRWRADDQRRRWQDDVQVLLDITVDGAVDETSIKRRSTRWIRNIMTRTSILRWLRIDDYCHFVCNDQCRVWFNNDEVAQTNNQEMRMQMGDYIRVLIPEDEGRSVLDQDRTLRRMERELQLETFYPDTTAPSDSLEDEEEEESEISEDSRRTLEEPEPHDQMRGQKIDLLAALQNDGSYNPPKVTEKATKGLQFSGVWDLLRWLDAAITQPSWLPPLDVDWPEVSNEWIDTDWWMLQHVDEIRFYTDGSKMREGAGAATILFIRDGDQWHFGGYLSQPSLVKCAHYAELLAIAMSFHWLNNLLMYCSMTQTELPYVTFAFDATSAGYKAFGNWGGFSYPDEAANIRSVWHMLASRYNFHWDTIHVRSHQGNPGNEMADAMAKAAALGRFNQRSVSTWRNYIMITRDVDIKWLWTLWKPEWKEYWNGSELWLPPRPNTMPDVSHCFGFDDSVTEEQVIPSSTFCCNVATANVLTLMPNAKTASQMGLQGKARTESIMQMAHLAQLHIVGLQETRMRKIPKAVTKNYFVFGGAASQRGHYGTQLWFSRTLALDEGQQCFFEKQHFRILSQGERVLMVRVWSPWFKAIVVCAHAPHSQCDNEERKKWWEALKAATPAKYKQWAHILLIDANGRVGEFPNQHVGDHQSDLQDDNGASLLDYLMEYNLWIPSTFETIHEGPGGTWHHHAKDQWHRGDYVALPLQWRLQHCHSAVRPEIDITLTKIDHQVVYAGFKWQSTTTSMRRSQPGWPLEKFDTTHLATLFMGPHGDSNRTSLLEMLPVCDWSTDVHTHTSFLQQEDYE